jgi:flagellar biosynthesis/type III secretory pathway protein FliH
MTLARRIEQQRVREGEPRTVEQAAVAVVALADVDPDAIDRGYRDGLAAGLAEAEAARAGLERQWRADIEAELAVAQDAVAAVHSRYVEAIQRLSREVEDDRLWAESLAVEVAFAAVTRWVGTHYLDGRTVEQLCTEIMRELPTSVFSVRVSPGDAAVLGTTVSALDLVIDPALADGELRLHSSRGSFDVGVRMRLDAVRDALLTSLNEGRIRG